MQILFVGVQLTQLSLTDPTPLSPSPTTKVFPLSEGGGAGRRGEGGRCCIPLEDVKTQHLKSEQVTKVHENKHNILEEV